MLDASDHDAPKRLSTMGEIRRATHEAAGPFEELGVGELCERMSLSGRSGARSGGPRRGRIDLCVRLHASHRNPAFSALAKDRLASD